MKTPPASILLFAVVAVLGAFGQFLYKSGAERASGGLFGYVANWRILAGAIMYVGVMVLLEAQANALGEARTFADVPNTHAGWAELVKALEEAARSLGADREVKRRA